MAPYLSDTGPDGAIDRFLVGQVLLIAIILFVILTKSEVFYLLRGEARVVKQCVGHTGGTGQIQICLLIESPNQVGPIRSGPEEARAAGYQERDRNEQREEWTRVGAHPTSQSSLERFRTAPHPLKRNPEAPSR